MGPFTHTLDTSFEELFKHHYPKLCLFAVSLVKDDAIAEDLVQETFIRVWNLKETVEPSALSQALLYGAVRNACFNFLRRQKLEHSYLNERQAEPFEEAVALNYMIRSEVIAEINRIISTLPDGCQTIFKMGYLEGLKNNEIAQQLGISINTVKTQKQRGLKLLKLRLDPKHFTIFILFLAR